MRQLTLDSNSAFGTYQLLKTWIEDYVSIAIIRETSLVPDPSHTSTSSIPGLSVEIPPFEAGRDVDLATAIPPPPPLAPSNSISHLMSSASDLTAIDPALLDASLQLALPYQDYRMRTPKPSEQPIFAFPKMDF
jgi:hypothetical protein